MRLDLNVLWIDDQKDSIRSSIDRLRREMKNRGFQLRETLVTSVAAAKKELADDVFTDNIDLVLVDYDLGRGAHGDMALREIRTSLPYREIVFYSAKAAGELRELAYKQKVEGVFCTSRTDLIGTATGVIDTLIKKVLDVDHSRGIVMGATSDIDHLVHDALLHLHDGYSVADRERMREGIIKVVDRKMEELGKKAVLAKKGALADIFGYYDLVTANDKLRLLKAELKSQSFEGIGDATKKIGQYTASVVPKRNVLGHVRMVVVDGVRMLRDRKGKELTGAEIQALRKELLDHRENFHGIATSIGVVFN